MDSLSWRTIEMDAEFELVEKRSRFIARAFCVTDESTALEKLMQIKTQHRDAAHNVYAYYIRENNIARFSDDGEPGGTAGMPAMDILKKENLVDVMVVVTRYFGGTLLGTGGLVRAYSASAKGAIDAAKIITVKCLPSFKVLFPYEYLRAVQNRGYIQISADYGENVSLLLCAEDPNRFINDMNDATNGTAKIIEGEIICQRSCC